MANMELVKSIRNKTLLSLKDINKAIDELQTTDEDKIIAHLREQGALKMEKRQDRQTSYGAIFSYIHEGRIGVLLEVRSETDFVARSESFQELGKNLGLHIAASQPKFVKIEEMDQNFVASEMEIARHLLENEGKPANMIEKILEGKKSKLAEEVCLLEQSYIKNPDIKIKQLVMEVSQSTGEKLEITRFTIYSL